MRHLAAILLVGLLILPVGGKARTKAQQDCEDRLKKDVTYLASDECEGRGPNTRGIDRAAEYIRNEFFQHLKMPKGGWYQPFGTAGATGKLALAGPLGQRAQLAPRKQFSVIGHNESADVTGPLVFVGYGISADGYNDYAGQDVKDRIVVMLRDTPRAGRNDLPLGIRRGGGIAVKLTVAHKMGAKAVFIVNDPDTAIAGDTPPDWSYLSIGRKGSRAPAVFVRRAIIDLLMPAGTTLRDVERRIDREMKPHSFPLAWTAGLEITRGDRMTPLKNVIGVLEGKGPLANQTVVVGAHYDHLGYGNPESSLYHSKRRAVHHGADDNASGVAGLIELARRFAARPDRQGRRIVFASFSGEELGLFGSEHYCKDPPFPLSETVAMLNLDMIGRPARDAKTKLDLLLTEGHGTAEPSFRPMMEKAAEKQGFTLSMRAAGAGGPSDHASFCDPKVKVPAIFLWTGEHVDYHRPTDTVDRIDLGGMRRIVDLSEELLLQLTTMPRPRYVEVKGEAVKPSEGPKLGIGEVKEREDGGLEVVRLTEGGPASKAGMQAGDVIVSVGRDLVKDRKGYVMAVATLRRGTTIEVGVQRGRERLTLNVALPE